MSNWKWNQSYDEDENLDWLMVRNGPIIKYFSSSVLEEDIKKLENMRYNIIDLSTSNWTIKNAHIQIKDGFGFPDYYGGNRNAFEDCLNDMFNKKYKGLVIVFRNFDNFYSQNKDFSESILDGIMSVSWIWLLAGQKLITLIQSDNPNLEIRKIGGFEPSWNSQEWLNSSRENG
jgi:RNAse (barnase) inhibitor barstar